ncbi:MAG: thiamine pyrophosphate-binding protein [Chloroflexi bacterium]|nr:thiamine pyrophosphate-binding protein [Chloroflexota bacterium]
MATGAKLLVDGLARLGVERLFTLSGNQILTIYDACLDAGIAVTDTRHEAAAGHMAEAWARLRDVPGVCLVSAGPGHTNTITASANALRNEVPLLWLSGGSDTRHDGRGGFQELDQAALATPVCKAARRVTRAGDMAEALAWAWRTMLTGRPGPVHLTVPSDVLAAATDAVPLDLAACLPVARAAAAADVAAAAERLHRAARPLIVAGPPARGARLGAALAGLAERLGAPLLVLDSPRGLTDPALHGAGQAVPLADAVLVLAPRDFALAFGGPKALAADAISIAIEPDADELASGRVLVGDALTVVRQLTDTLPAQAADRSAWRAQIDELRAAGEARHAAAATSMATPIHPLRVAAEMRALLPPAASVSIDGGSSPSGRAGAWVARTRSDWSTASSACSGRQSRLRSRLGWPGRLSRRSPLSVTARPATT